MMEFDDGLDCYSMEVLLLRKRAKHIRAEMLNSNRKAEHWPGTISAFYRLQIHYLFTTIYTSVYPPVLALAQGQMSSPSQRPHIITRVGTVSPTKRSHNVYSSSHLQVTAVPR